MTLEGDWLGVTYLLLTSKRRQSVISQIDGKSDKEQVMIRYRAMDNSATRISEKKYRTEQTLVAVLTAAALRLYVLDEEGVLRKKALFVNASNQGG